MSDDRKWQVVADGEIHTVQPSQEACMAYCVELGFTVKVPTIRGGHFHDLRPGVVIEKVPATDSAGH